MSTPDALYPAVAAVIVALIGVAGNAFRPRRKDADLDDEASELEAELDLLRNLSSAWQEERDRRLDLERRLADCEEREKKREQ